jgi:hypothetical protein
MGSICNLYGDTWNAQRICWKNHFKNTPFQYKKGKVSKLYLNVVIAISDVELWDDASLKLALLYLYSQTFWAKAFPLKLLASFFLNAPA